MGLFSKPEVIIIRESYDAKRYLANLENLLPSTHGDLQKQIQKEIVVTKAGIVGEDNILFELRNSNMDMVVLHDIYIETKDGLGAQIDFIVITAKMTFIIECKNLYGNIEIDSKGNFIRTLEYGGKKHKEGIYSPITQNERHMEVLKERKAEEKNFIWGAISRSFFEKYYKPLIVLANPRTVVNYRYAKKEVKEQVLRADQMISVIKRMNSESKELSSSKKEMIELGEKLLSYNIDERKDCFTKFQELKCQIEREEINKEPIYEKSVKNEQTREDEKMVCPKCGLGLVLRTAKKGTNAGKQFYGCSNFPKCRFTLSLENNKN